MTLREMIDRKVRGAQERKERRQIKRKMLWPKTINRKRLVASNDRLFSIHIRRRDKKRFGRCPFFHIELVPATQCFHFLSRVKYATRWNEYNAVASCGGCNIRYEHDTLFVHQVKSWYETYYGSKVWETLELAGHRKTPIGDDELLAINHDLKIKVGSEI